MNAERYFFIGLVGGTVMLIGLLTMNWYVLFGGAAVALSFGILGTRAWDRD